MGDPTENDFTTKEVKPPFDMNTAVLVPPYGQNTNTRDDARLWTVPPDEAAARAANNFPQDKKYKEGPFVPAHDEDFGDFNDLFKY